MVGPIAPGGANRASQPRQAADIAARISFLLRRNNMVDATSNVVAVLGKGVHGAVRQAWLIRTSVTWMRLFRARKLDRFAQKDRGAIGMPEATDRMNLDSDRR